MIPDTKYSLIFNCNHDGFSNIKYRMKKNEDEICQEREKILLVKDLVNWWLPDSPGTLKTQGREFLSGIVTAIVERTVRLKDISYLVEEGRVVAALDGVQTR